MKNVNCEGFYDNRERCKLTPPRYSEVSSIPSIEKLLKEMGNKWKKSGKSLNYVDLGCGDCKGTQFFTEFLNRTTDMIVNATGIDVSPSCESPCREKGIRFQRANLGSEPIPLQSCQVATMFETIEHIFDTDYLLRSIHDCLSADSILLVSTLNVVCWKNRILVPLGIQPINTEVSTEKLVYGYRFDWLRARVKKWVPAGHIRPFTLSSLVDMLEDNRFRVIRSYGLENWRMMKFLEHLSKNACTGILVLVKPL